MGDTTPLYLAAQRGFTEVVRVLLAAGADRDFEMPTAVIGSSVAHVATGYPVPDEDTDQEARMTHYFRSMHQEGSDPSASDFEQGNGATALHAAVENGHLETVRVLLEHGVRQTNSMQGATPLITAVQYNHPVIAALLMQYEAHQNARLPRDGQTALHWAVTARRQQMVKVLLTGGVDVNVRAAAGDTPLHRACSMGHLPLIKMLLDAGADLAIPTQDGATCLHLAVDRGLVEVIQFLLARLPDMDVSARIRDGRAPLHMAATRYSVTVLNTLLDHGAEVDSALPDCGSTALMLAAGRGLESNIRVLVQRGANATARGTARVYNPTALHHAAQQPNVKAVEALLEAKQVDVNARLSIGTTPLVLAAEAGHAGVIATLLATGLVRINLRTAFGHTALRQAVNQGWVEVAQQLLQAGAQINTLAKDGTTPLHAAVMRHTHHKEVAIAKLLLEHGADPGLAAADGQTPLDLARKQRNFDLIKLLGQYEASEMQDDTAATADADDTEELPDVVMVTRVHQAGQSYLVDKRKGLVFADTLEDPQQLGTWSEETGVVLDPALTAAQPN